MIIGLLHYIEAWRWLMYTVIFLALIFEGEVILFTAAFLVHQGYLDFYDTLWITLLGLFFGDFLWYYFGFNLEKIPFIKKHFDQVSGFIDKQIAHRPFLTMLVSKFTYGLHRPTLIRFSILRVPFKTYLKSEVPASLIWLSVIGFIAVVFSASVGFTRRWRHFKLGLIGGIITILLLGKLISLIVNKYFRKE